MRNPALSLAILAMLIVRCAFQPADAAEPDAISPTKYSQAEIAAAQAWFTSLTPSGDALFDAYARALVDKYGAEGFAFEPDTPYYFIDDALFKELLAAHGDDPHYWELRSFNARIFLTLAQYQEDLLDGSTEPERAELGSSVRLDYSGEYESPAELAIEAIARGAANSSLLSRYCLDELHRLSSDADERAEVIAKLPGLDQSQKQAQLDAVQEQFYGAADELLGQMQALDSSAAWPHYMQALQCFRRGQEEEGWQSLEIGNSLEGLAWVDQGYPLSFLLAELREGRRPGNAVVCAAIQSSSTAQDLWPMSEHRIPRYLSGRLAHEADLNRQAALLKMLGRFCHDSRGHDLDQLTWLSVWRMAQRDVLVLNGDRLSAEQRYVLLSQVGGSAQSLAELRINTRRVDPSRLLRDFTGPYRWEEDIAERLPELATFWAAYSERQLLQASILRPRILEYAQGKDFLLPLEDDNDYFQSVGKRNLPRYSFELDDVLEDIAASEAFSLELDQMIEDQKAAAATGGQPEED